MNKKLIVHIGAGGESPIPSPDTTYYLFEPREDSKLNTVKAHKNINVYDYALSDFEGEQVLNLTNKLSCSSFYEPNIELIKHYQPSSWSRFQVSKQVTVNVKRLDSIIPLDSNIIKLIIDTQGAELDILKGAGDLLHNVQTLICEVEFVELYKDQPLFNEVQEYVLKYGLEHTGFKRKVKWKNTEIFGDATFSRK